MSEKPSLSQARNGASIARMHVQAQLAHALGSRSCLYLMDQHLQEPMPSGLGDEVDELQPPVVRILPVAPLGGDRDGAEQAFLPVRENPVACQRGIPDGGGHGLGDGCAIELAVFCVPSLRQHEIDL